MSIELVVTIGINLLLVAVAAGVVKNKVENNEKQTQEEREQRQKEVAMVKAECEAKIQELKLDLSREIESIKGHQEKVDEVLDKISTTVTEVNSKVDRMNDTLQMLIQGRIVIGPDKQ